MIAMAHAPFNRDGSFSATLSLAIWRELKGVPGGVAQAAAKATLIFNKPELQMEGLTLIVYDQLIPIYLTYLVLVIAIRAYAISLHPEVQVVVVNDIMQIRSSYSVRLCASLIEKQFVPPMLIVYQQRHITIIKPRRFFKELQEHIRRGYCIDRATRFP